MCFYIVEIFDRRLDLLEILEVWISDRQDEKILKKQFIFG